MTGYAFGFALTLLWLSSQPSVTSDTIAQGIVRLIFAVAWPLYWAALFYLAWRNWE